MSHRTTSKTERAREFLGVPELPDLLPEEIELIESSVGDRHLRFFVSFCVVCATYDMAAELTLELTLLGNTRRSLWTSRREDLPRPRTGICSLLYSFSGNSRNCINLLLLFQRPRCSRAPDCFPNATIFLSSPANKVTMDMGDSLNPNNQPAFTEFRQPVSPTFTSPSARHLHTRSSESALSSFYNDLSPTSSRFAESAIPFTTMHSVPGYLPDSDFTSPEPTGPHQQLQHSFNSSRYPSSPPSGFETPATPSEHHQAHHPHPYHGLPSEPAQHATFSTSQVIITGILDG